MLRWEQNKMEIERKSSLSDDPGVLPDDPGVLPDDLPKLIDNEKRTIL